MSARLRREARARGRFGVALRWLFAAALFGAFQVWLQLQAKEVGYELTAARSLAHRLAEDNRKLELELATITSMASIDERARRRLGLRTPVEGQIVGLP